MQTKKLQIPLDISTIELKPYLDSRILVVSVFGKSAKDAASFKANILDDVLKKQIFRRNILEPNEINSDILSDIDAYYDPESSVMFLHLRGVYDTHTLTTILQQISAQLQDKGFLYVWSDMKNKYARAVLFLFLVSHVLILSHPSYTFDMSYVQLFKTLDMVRPRLLSLVQDTLAQVHEMSPEWLALGRLCTPRLVFLFEAAPRFLVQGPRVRDLPEETLARLTAFELRLEEQIFNILRSSRVICHVSTNALFALPARHRYVYVQNCPSTLKQDWLSFFLDSLVPRNPGPSRLGGSVPPESDDQWVPRYGLENEEHIMRPERHEFRLFLANVLDDARYRREFDDDFGSNAYVRPLTAAHRVERPLLRTWISSSALLWRTLVVDQQALVSAELSDSMDADIKFSEERCSKVLPLAFNVYKDNLPSHYNTQFHETRVTQAFNSFSIHARGPLFDLFLSKLEDECIQYWTRGRQMCEVTSLKGNPCVNPLHKGGSGYSGYEFDSSRADLPIMEHSSGLRFMSSCDCGRTQGQREDPFSLREANYEFYQVVGAQCGCAALEHFPFPVFQPSTEDFRAAQLFTNPESKLLGRRDSLSNMSLGKELLHNATQPGTQGLSLAYASGHSLVSDVLTHHPVSVTQAHTVPRGESNLLSLASQQIVIQVCDSETEPSRDKALVRQPSTTEYLPGMLHSDSPSSLLPQYPSWSLVYLGPSSLYSHNLGLPDPAGSFVASSSYLLPWDVTVRLQHHSKDGTWAKTSTCITNRNTRKKQPAKDLNEFSVKIFIGVEYECPLGHRFMASAPDKILKTCGQGIVKDNGNKVTSSDMPLYFPCPCRASSTAGTGGGSGGSGRLLAQLMRLHVVTPKAPVHVTLCPRVQPGPPPTPVFVTGAPEPIRLSQSAYWVLRLPYVYAGERGPCLPQQGYASAPGDASVPYARLLAGVYGITEVTSAGSAAGELKTFAAMSLGP